MPGPGNPVAVRNPDGVSTTRGTGCPGVASRRIVAMQGIILRTAINALGLGVAAVLLPGITIQGLGTLLIAALLMGLVNALLRPIVVLVTLPITIVTFGLFLLVINAALFGLVAALLEGFAVSGFFAALFGWLIVSVIGVVSSWYIGPDGRYEILIIEKQRW